MEVKNCKVSCESKLKEVEQTFRECFSLKSSHSIEAVLRKAQTPQKTNQNCWRSIKDIAEKYRRQSLGARALLKDNLKSVDVTDCESIKQEISQRNLKDFSMEVCQRAQKQKKREEEQKRRAQEQKRREQAKGYKSFQDKGVTKVEKGNLKKEKDDKRKVKKPKKETTAKDLKGSTGSLTSTKTQKKMITKQKVALGKIPERVISFSGVRSQHDYGFLARQQVESFNLPGHCPAPFPEIKSAVVFQSVEAPQIEPMSQQANPPYDDYDLVKGKPAGY